MEYLTSNCNANILVYENDHESKWKKYISNDLRNKCRHKFFKNPEVEGVFNKCKLLNEMTIDAKTPIICMHDCDLIIPNFDEYVEALEFVINHEFSYCVPYNRVEKYEVTEKYRSTMKKCHLKLEKTAGSPPGGVIMLSKKNCIMCGMWNEKFESWGQEDNEFYSRLQILLKNGRRGTTNLIHYNHPKQKTGFYRHGKTSNKYIWKEIEKMPEDKLRELVKSWPWVKLAKERIKKI